MSDETATLSVGEARDAFAEIINRAGYGHERLRIARRGKPVAALISIEDLELLEALEEAQDLAEHRRVLARIEAGEEDVIPLENVLKKLGEDA